MEIIIKNSEVGSILDDCRHLFQQVELTRRQDNVAHTFARRHIEYSYLLGWPKLIEEMGNEISKRNDGNSVSFTRAVDDAIRSNTSSILGCSPVRSFGSLIDSVIRTSTASTTDADFDLLFHTLGLSGLENFEITPPPEQQAQAQQPLLQTAETINAVTPPLLPLNTGFTSRSVSRSAYDTNSNSRNSLASKSVTYRSEGEILQSPNLKSFSYNELRAATRNFRPDSVLRDHGFGPVFKGWIDENSLTATKQGKGMIVAVKRLYHGIFGHREWLAEINYLGQLQHPNLVRLIGYCYEDDHRLLVYEFMPKGSMENHLFRRGSYFRPISWSLRMKIALGAAKGLAFIHSTEPKVIFRDFKTSDILLDTNYNAKLSDFGLARDGPIGDESHVFTRIMGTYRYAAPEEVATGHLTTKSDVFCFGVVLLEMISGRRAIDMNQPSGEYNLFDWARPYLRNKRRVFRVMDPGLVGQYSQKRAQAALLLTLQCLAVESKHRPNMDEVVKALEQLQESNNMH